MERKTFWERFEQAEGWFGRTQLLWTIFSMPSVVTMLAAVSGYLGNIQAMWIIMACSITFGAVTTSMLRYSEWRFRTMVRGKVDIAGIYQITSCIWNKAGKPTHIDRVNIGFVVSNRATFPIEIRIEKLQIVAAKQDADVSQIEGKVYDLPFSAASNYHPGAIDLSKLKTLDVNGKLAVEISYGKKNKPKFPITKKYEFDLVVHPKESNKPVSAVGFAPRDINLDTGRT